MSPLPQTDPGGREQRPWPVWQLPCSSEAKVCMTPVAGDRFTFLFTWSAENCSTLFDAEEENQCWFFPNASSTKCQFPVSLREWKGIGHLQGDAVV